MNRLCSNCKNSFTIADSDKLWLNKLAPRFGDQIFTLPEPTHCPVCRLQRRASFRNDQNYYRNNCSLCQTSLISIYSPDKSIPVLCESCYWSDNWNALEYGVDFDPEKPFFDQFAKMKAAVPRLAIFNTQSENSRYTVHSSRNKDCYMSSSLCDCEDTLYSDLSFNIKKSCDLFSCEQVELCYECSYSENCYDCEYLDHCYGLTESALCYDCRGSSQLMGCIGLRRAQFQILNKPVSKELFIETIRKFRHDRHFKTAFLQDFEKLRALAFLPAHWVNNVENVTGDNLTQCKNVDTGFNLKFCEDVRFSFEGNRQRDCCDAFRVANGEMLYECAAIVDSKFSSFCNLTYQCSSMLYCDNCQAGSQDCFGCMGLKKQQYCILNKRYSREEYEKIVPGIVEQMRRNREWGEFFPVELSPFGYNETKAAELFPLSNGQVREKGWQWSEYQAPLPAGMSSLPSDSLPHSSNKSADALLDCAILCISTKKPFRLVKAELEFYRQKDLPLPEKSPSQRRLDRASRHNPMQLWQSICVDCLEKVTTSSPPDALQKICCESCYLKRTY